MKKWENPRLSLLGIEKTKTNELCNCGATLYSTEYSTDKNQHYCHRDGIWHRNNCPSLNQGHFQSGSRCPSGGNHEWAGQSHKSNCCCAGWEDTGGGLS